MPPEDTDVDHPVREVDVVNAYALFLGRPPEDEGAVADKVGLARAALIAQFASSVEFEDRVERPTIEGRLPFGPLFEQMPELALVAWASAFLPLSDPGRQRLAAAVTWVGVFEAIFTDDVFKQATPELERLHTPGRFAAQLETLNANLGARVLVSDLESASSLSVSGFLFDRAAPAVPMAVELWIDGVFTAAVLADVYRRDLQERFGSSGAHGFTFEGFTPPDETRERRVRVEVRDAGSKTVVGSRFVSWRPGRDMAQLGELGRQLDAIRDMLDRMQGTVEHLTGAFGFTVGGWDAYWRAYYVSPPASQEALRLAAEDLVRRPRFGVVLTAEHADADALTKTLLSLRGQVWRDFVILLADEKADAAAVADVAATEAYRLEDAGLGDDHVVILDAGDLLAPDALHRFAAALQTTDAAVLYGDSDTLIVSPFGRERHVDPVLRPDFDPDLLIQTPMIGPVAAIASDVLQDALRSGGSFAREARDDLLLRVAYRPGARVVHVPRVIHHAAAPVAQAPDYASVVAAQLERLGSHARVTAPAEGDAAARSTARVAWPLPEGLKAAVIVPTRDRLDLLGPCLASLMTARGSNATEIEIVVVDNGSAEAATRRFLGSLAASGGVRLLSFEGAFNWSAINNHAARSTDADVLIFLNNDTVVLDQDFVDTLCRQAMRPDVGAVGARLLYEDGSVQHAGLILGAGDGVALHEGVGASSEDAGYLGRRGLVHRASAVTGACLATRADLFGDLGGFDEDRLAVEANDIDYCLRLRRKGLAVVYDPGATLYHFESKSRGHTGLDEARRRKADAEIATLRERWGEMLQADPYYNAHFDRAGPPFARLGPPPP